MMVTVVLVVVAMVVVMVILLLGAVSGTTGRRDLCLFSFQSCWGGGREGPGKLSKFKCNVDIVVSAGAGGGGG